MTNLYFHQDNKFKRVFKKIKDRGVRNLKVTEEKKEIVDTGRHVYLWRLRESKYGTEGMILTPGFHCKTIEPVWKNNRRQVSCIPSDVYNVTQRISPKFGKVYWVLQVPGRSYILFHSGNFAGDQEDFPELKTHTMGCILLGQYHGWIGEQRAVLNSRITTRRFTEHTKFQDFNLHIIDWALEKNHEF